MENGTMTILQQLGDDRRAIMQDLERNTRHLQQTIQQAKQHGYSNYRIAQLTGVTKRTVAIWSQK